MGKAEADTIRSWEELSHLYESKVFSVTSFRERRQRILREIVPGAVADVGCGPLGLMLSEICRLPKTIAIGSDSCLEMIVQSRNKTESCDVRYVVADNRQLPFPSSSMDTIVSINSFVPESREDVELMFQQSKRVLRKGGRLVAMLPSFEMSLIARDTWRMPVRLDLKGHREWETSGWQCFYTEADIHELVRKNRFPDYRLDRVAFSTPEEVTQIRRVYGDSVRGIPDALFADYPLFEHLLIAER
jgi:SAM-dependent methyltransferase